MTNLFIDTSTQALMVALEKDGAIIDATFELAKNDHSTRLMPTIERLFEVNDLTTNELSSIYIGAGPGSYTGVRIGVTVAKMLAWTLHIPLYELSSLATIAAHYIEEASILIPIIDARRNNVFATIYQVEAGKLVPVLEEGLYPIDQLKQLCVENKWSNPLYVGLDTEQFTNYFEREQLSYSSELKAVWQPKRLFSHTNARKVDEIHHFSPNYRRITEAERNLNE